MAILAVQLTSPAGVERVGEFVEMGVEPRRSINFSRELSIEHSSVKHKMPEMN